MKFERYGRGIAKGLTVTIKHLFRPSPTTQYPEQKLTISRRMRGNDLVWDKERCTGCGTCAKSCPQGAINIETSVGEENNYIVEKLEIDTGYCIACGLCVEACPYEALFMGYSYELGKYRRQELVMVKEDLLLTEERQPSGYARPKVEATLPLQTLLIDRNKVKK